MGGSKCSRIQRPPKDQNGFATNEKFIGKRNGYSKDS